MFDFGSPHINYLNEICILILFFLAQRLSLSFDQTILRNKGGERGLFALQFFGYLKRQLELIIFNERFLLVKNIRNLRINLRNKLLYSYIFIMYVRG